MIAATRAARCSGLPTGLEAAASGVAIAVAAATASAAVTASASRQAQQRAHVHAAAATGAQRPAGSPAAPAALPASSTPPPMPPPTPAISPPGSVPPSSSPPPRPVASAPTPYTPPPSAAPPVVKPQPQAPAAGRPPSSGQAPTSVVTLAMPVSAFAHDPSVDHPVASGKVTSRIAANVFAVTFDDYAPQSPVVEVGTRVLVALADGRSNGGLVAKAHGNGTYAVLMDDDTFENAVARDAITVVEGRTKFSHSERFAQVLKWVRDAGVQRKADAYSASSILYRRGWRVNTLYLLEGPDVHCLSHLNKSVRMGILEAADAERDKQRHLREVRKEQMKESEWRYFVQKYISILGVMTTLFGAASVFTWNLKNWRKAQRPAQVQNAVDAILARYQQIRPARGAAAAAAAATASEPEARPTDDDVPLAALLRAVAAAPAGAPEAAGHGPLGVETQQDVAAPTTPTPEGIASRGHVRRADEVRLQKVLSHLSTAFPRILVVSGNAGCGKTVVMRRAADASRVVTVMIDVRGKDRDDPVRAIARTLGVTNQEICGNMFDFLAEVCHEAAKHMHGTVPLIVLKLHDDSLGHVYDDAVTLACDRRAAHIAIEVTNERVKRQLLQRPRTEVFHVNEFTHDEAVAYCAHRVDPVALEEFLATVGTNSTDLDELMASVEQRGMDPFDVVTSRLTKGVGMVRQLPRDVAEALRFVAATPYEKGVRTPPPNVDLAAERGVVVFHPERNVWMAKDKALHECTRIVYALD